jgi:hypothetical protein
MYKPNKNVLMMIKGMVEFHLNKNRYNDLRKIYLNELKVIDKAIESGFDLDKDEAWQIFGCIGDLYNQTALVCAECMEYDGYNNHAGSYGCEVSYCESCQAVECGSIELWLIDEEKNYWVDFDNQVIYDENNEIIQD